MRGKILALLLSLVMATSAAIDWEAQGRRWWSHVEYLASDKLEGRNTGSEGYR